jgi:hypothetical protein
MPFKPHPTDPTKVIYTTGDYWIPKPWQGLTDEEIKGILDCGRGGLVDIKKAEQMLKEKNT